MFLFYKLKRNNCIIVLGFEQSNDFLTSDLFKATNRHEGVDENEEDDSASTDNYIVQLLLRFLRLEHIEEEEEDEEEEDEEL